MATKGAKTKETGISFEIKKPDIVKAVVTIVGDTPLLVHAWSDKAKKEMLDAQQKKRVDKKARAIRDPFAEFMEAAYWITPKPEESTVEAFESAIRNGAKFGFPVVAIKKAALSACYRAGLIPNQAGMRSVFRIAAVDGVGNGAGELAVIESDEPPQLREDPVKVGGISKTSDLRYRPQFNNWRIKLLVTLIDVGTFDMASVINAIDLGGMMNGIGEWRTEKDGVFGQYHVEVTD